MGFIQIIEYKTSRIDEVQALGEKFRADAVGRSTLPVRVTITKDRDQADIYRTIVEFESYETAMANSEDPQTSEFAARMAELVDAPPTFLNLDVIAES